MGTLFVVIFLAALAGRVAAHPLGNFTINHFARVEAGAERVRVRYVVDMAEIPTFQQSQTIDADRDGKLSQEELDAYLKRVVPQYAEGLVVTVGGARVALKSIAENISIPAGDGGLPTLRVETQLEGELPPGEAGGVRRLRFENTNDRGRAGWYEIVVAPAPGSTIFDSTAYGSAVTNELRAYPQDLLFAPLDERAAEFSWSPAGSAPATAAPLKTRDGRPVVGPSRDRLAELIAVPELTTGVALLGLLFATGLGALHALSPGHGKTVVGAYLVGSRGTPSHAAFLGLTVTITHTAGVFALGLVTLFASQYVVPERLYPVLGFVSGAIVLSIGLSLFIRRLRAMIGGATLVHDHHHDDAHDHSHHHRHGDHEHSDAHAQSHTHDHAHSHTPAHAHGHHAHSHHEHSHRDHEHSHHSHAGDPFVHTHDGHTHSHLPPGTDGAPVTWRSLLALGISGGLLPCPSALVVLLSAITLGRVGYGLALVVAFSVGLAATLTAIGLLFVYAKQFIERPMRRSGLVRVLPVASALIIAGVGAVLCYEALAQTGAPAAAFAESTSTVVAAAAPGAHEVAGADEPSLASLGALAVLGLGLVFGLKHATEADHVVAVSTIVSEHRNLWRAALVGALWGAGHTASLIVVGVIVLALRVTIPERVGAWLEFGVALMIIGLGIAALARALRQRPDVHVHRHTHDGVAHAHVHFHEGGTEHDAGAVATAAAHSHAVMRIGLKPLIVGAVHGLAGSAALTLLVLTQIQSMVVGVLYLIVFGVGSIAGMLMMSSLVGLPFALSARRFSGWTNSLQTIAGMLSIAFGIWYAYDTGVASDLLAKVL